MNIQQEQTFWGGAKGRNSNFFISYRIKFHKKNSLD